MLWEADPVADAGTPATAPDDDLQHSKMQICNLDSRHALDAPHVCIHISDWTVPCSKCGSKANSIQALLQHLPHAPGSPSCRQWPASRPEEVPMT